jgi:signal transduction histidine kinase
VLATYLRKIPQLFQKVSIRAKLALLLLLVFGSTTVVFNAILFVFTIETLQRDFDDALFNYSVDVSESIEIDREGDLAFPPLKVDHGKILPFPLGTALIQVRDEKGNVVARVGDFGTFDPPLKNDFLKIRKGEEAVFRTIEVGNQVPSAEALSYRVISFPLDNVTNPHYLLQIAVPMHLLESQIKNRLYYLQVGIPLVLIIAAFVGFFVSGRALAPVTHMIQTAQSIDVHELSQRVPVPMAKDEIKQLALTLNEMLDRIEKAFQSQERFVADASHQLLTPLTIMKGEIERALKPSANEDEKKRVFKSTLQEVDHLSRIVKDMLLLARVDAGLGALNLQSLSLDEVIIDALVRVEGLAHSKNIKIKFDIQENQQERRMVRGDFDLVLHVIVILLENAIKYSPPGEMVQIGLIWSQDTSEVIVRDQGPGIPMEERASIFERFRRGQDADRTAQGYGLGLAIAQKIAQLHSSKLYLAENAGKGAEFHFEIKNI